MNDLIKSPLNYVGGKYKLLSQLLPLFPKDISTFYDLFGGGGNVFINADAKNYVYNDIDKHVSSLLHNLHYYGKDSVEYIDKIIERYGLTKENREGFLKLREDFNKSEQKPFYMFYGLICYSFNNQIRFNSKGEFNMPFGKDKSSFNPKLRENFLKYCDKLHSIENMQFCNKDFSEFNPNDMVEKDFVYCDPPYLVTCAAYNDIWDETNEKKLLSYLDSLDSKNIRFGLSNVLENKGKTNDILKDWVEKRNFNVHHLNHTYGNCNYHALDKSNDSTDEVFICNYECEEVKKEEYYIPSLF